MTTTRHKLASFAAGCFWGVEEAFLSSGLCVKTTCGYSGGTSTSPTYQQVCTGTTNHAESVLCEYDPSSTSYSQLLSIFWSCHDPTTKNRQGPDHGTQYRSVIFCHDEEQWREARESVAAQGKVWWPKQVVTEVVRHERFYEAEPVHQQYLRRKGRHAACHL
jgi:peptide-methionine (S)-S-oxide reductase